MSRAFKTTLLDRSLRREKQENEKARHSAIRKLLRILPRLAEKYGFSQAYIFGSLAKKGRFHKNSDIDLAVSGLSDEYLFRFGAELSECMGREVDVLQVEQLKKRPHLNQRILEAAIEWKKKS